VRANQRRESLKLSAASIMARLLPVSALAAALSESPPSETEKGDTVTQASATRERSEEAGDKNAIRPFRVNVPEADSTELRASFKSLR